MGRDDFLDFDHPAGRWGLTPIQANRDAVHFPGIVNAAIGVLFGPPTTESPNDFQDIRMWQVVKVQPATAHITVRERFQNFSVVC